MVELVPAPWTSQATQDAARKLMKAVGQKPVCLTREVDGFVLNRGAIHQLLSIIHKLRILVLLPVSTMPYVVIVKNYS
jgi:3-hydroxyacyl-CoA dehydrogenase